MLSAEPSLFDACTELLSSAYGPVDFETEIAPWTFTDYYRDEMGGGLVRKFVFFARLMDPAALADVKIYTNEIEKRMAMEGRISIRRAVNLDPGYIAEAKVVLASTKDFSHRVYVGRGIYAEVTLQYRSKDRTFVALEHTYPDFRTKDSLSLFNRGRALLREAIHGK